MDKAMIVATVTQAAAVTGIITIIPAVVIAYFKYKRAIKTDALTAAAGMATTATVTTGQVLTSLNDIIERLSEDNAQLRDQLDKVTTTLEVVRGKLDHKDELIVKLRADVAAYMRKNGVTQDPDLSKSDDDPHLP